MVDLARSRTGGAEAADLQSAPAPYRNTDPGCQLPRFVPASTGLSACVMVPDEDFREDAQAIVGNVISQSGGAIVALLGHT